MLSLESRSCDVAVLPEECRKIIRGNLARLGTLTEVHRVYGVTVFLLMTNSCNLKCDYCYQPTKFKEKVSWMTPEMIDLAIEFAITSLREDKVRFNFFGGEPLLNAKTLKYTVDKYPMMNYLTTTNGIALLKDKDLCDWYRTHRGNLQISLSIGGIRQLDPENFIENIIPLLDVVRNNGGDVHYVIADPTDPRVFDEVKFLFEYHLPKVRVSMTRHVDNLYTYQKDYVELFKRIADYVYFGDAPKLHVCNWDTALRNNIYKKKRGEKLTPIPPTFCGAGSVYVTITPEGDLYPCDMFTIMPQFKIGDVWNGFNETSTFFSSMKEWSDDLYEGCRACKVVEGGDIRLCPKSMCLAENYIVNENTLKPAPIHCTANKIDYELFSYISDKAIERGVNWFKTEPIQEVTC